MTRSFTFSLISLSCLVSSACGGQDHALGQRMDEVHDGKSGAGSGFGGSSNTTGGTGNGSAGTGGSSTNTGAVCGGIAGLPCADGKQCVDDPDDDCDPAVGADCGGICVAAPGPSFCGGFAPFVCSGDLLCVDDPSDDCDAASGGADCRGLCVDGDSSQMCGGIAGFQCPDGLSCVDDPRDDCAPPEGADCGGLCVLDPATGVSCDLSNVSCERAEPQCADGYAVSASGLCYGPCVAIETCSCSSAKQCPTGTTCSFDSGRCVQLPGG